jgi:hypothetical protein
VTGYDGVWRSIAVPENVGEWGEEWTRPQLICCALVLQNWVSINFGNMENDERKG